MIKKAHLMQILPPNFVVFILIAFQSFERKHALNPMFSLNNNHHLNGFNELTTTSVYYVFSKVVPALPCLTFI